jgi:ketosteroid isomerase-like protein
MYKLVVRRNVRAAFKTLSKGDLDSFIRIFASDARFWFAGDHALAGERRGRQQIRAWFEEALRRLPGLQIEPRDVIVNGWPWNTRVASHLYIHTVMPDGRRYENAGMQYVRLRWGRVVEDLIYEDTQRLAAELARTDVVAAA